MCQRKNTAISNVKSILRQQCHIKGQRKEQCNNYAWQI